MEINVRTGGNVTILDLHGNLTLGLGEETLTETVSQLLASGQRQFLVNLDDVPMIDSSGIGGLIKSFTRAKTQGARLKLLKPSKLVRQLLSITGLLSVFETFDDEATAVSSF